jgi:two-component system, OmpR family, KDP operon response regulator KdpE
MANAAPLILIVDDEPPIRRLVHTALDDEGYRVAEAESGQQAVRLATQQPPDVVILDLGLPDVDGQAVLRQLREWLRAPIIILSARDQEKEKVAALDSGADDYLTKPFNTGELLARIRVALRHAQRVTNDQSPMTFQVGELRLDFTKRQVFVGDREIHLTPIEYKLFSALAHDAGKVLTHRHLLNEVWGPHHLDETHYLRVFMASLRRKIEADSAQPRYLLTEQGVGYRLAAE